MLRNYPKRLDLWSVYLDQEVALGDAQRIRCGQLPGSPAGTGGVRDGVPPAPPLPDQLGP